MEDKTGKKIVRVAVLTPYLTERLSRHDHSEGFIQEQKEMFGYDPHNLNGERTLETPERIVRLETPGDHTMPCPLEADMIVAGSVDFVEDRVMALKRTGVIVARYSIFYGGPSKYTGRTPEESVYAIDIPKQVSAARALLTDDGVLKALEARDARLTREALAILNATLPQPVIATSFLEEALSVKT